MARINLTYKAHRNVVLSIGGHNYTVLVVEVNETFSNYNVGSDYLNTPSKVINPFIVSNYSVWYSSTEAATNINIGDTISKTVNNKTFSITRTNSNTYTIVPPVGSSYTRSATSGDICHRLILEDSAGVWLGGDITAGSFYSPFTLSTDEFFIIRTQNSNINIVWGTSDFAYNSTNLAWGEILKGSIAPSDPYANAGDSDAGGGGGTWDDGSDPVPVPSLPTVGATNTGFISLFVPTQAQLQQVANYLWSSLFDVSTFYKIFENPMDCILGLSVVPVSIPTSGNAQITVGNIELSGITLPLASQQYVEVDCGSLTIEPYFGSYLDYEPYTKMSLFVPYSGVHSVNADDLMGKTVQLVYHIDILTGSLVAFVKCGDSVLYEFNGACGSNIPVNSVNYASTIENAIRIAVNIGTTVATAGASAPATAGGGTLRAGQDVARGVSLVGSTAEGILSLKPNIDRAGSLGGTTGLLGNQTPYFIVTRPRLCKPAKQNFYKGYPAFISYTVEDLMGKGYTEWDTIILSTLYLTDDEKNELEGILAGGVYL